MNTNQISRRHFTTDNKPSMFDRVLDAFDFLKFIGIGSFFIIVERFLSLSPSKKIEPIPT
jgi:hypothetical protein